MPLTSFPISSAIPTPSFPGIHGKLNLTGYLPKIKNIINNSIYGNS